MRGLLVAAHRRGLSVQVLDLRNSGDTAGAGTGWWVTAPLPSSLALSFWCRPGRQRLLDLARASIRHGLARGHPLPVDPDALPRPWRIRAPSSPSCCRALRGCVGRICASRPLALDVADHAYAAAFQDGRFPPVAAGELDRLHIELSLFAMVPEPLDSAGDGT